MTRSHDTQWRRYRHPSGARLSVHKTNRKWVSIAPAWCVHIHRDITRQEAAETLRAWRAQA